MSKIDIALKKARARKDAKAAFTLPFTDQEITKHLRAKDLEDFDWEDLTDIDDLDRGAEQLRRLFPSSHPAYDFLTGVIDFCETCREVVREKLDEEEESE